PGRAGGASVARLGRVPGTRYSTRAGTGEAGAARPIEAVAPSPEASAGMVAGRGGAPLGRAGPQPAARSVAAASPAARRITVLMAGQSPGARLGFPPGRRPRA